MSNSHMCIHTLTILIHNTYIYIYTLHTCAHSQYYMQTHTHTHTYICIHTLTHAHTHSHTYVYTHSHMHIHTCMKLTNETKTWCGPLSLYYYIDVLLSV